MFYFIALLLLPGGVFAAPQTINIFTADANMPNFGDLVSNWYAARLLKNQHPDLNVNFYVSDAFYQRFQILEPLFAYRSPTKKRVPIKGINVYWNSFGEDKRARNTVIDEMLETGNNNLICNLEFTTNAELILGNELKDPFSYYVSMRALQSRNKVKRGTPFLGFLFLLQDTDKRFCMNEQGRLKTRKPPRFPLYMFTGALETGSLLVSARRPEFGLSDYDLQGHLGFAYAHQPEFRSDYIQRIANIARVNPAQTYIIVLGGNYAMDAFPGMRFERLMPQDYIHLHTVNADSLGVMQGTQNIREFYRPVNPAWGPNQLNNLYVVRYPGGVPFDVTQQVIRDSDLPVLVSGTMSLSLAVQYDKPFIYEVRTHHRKFSRALHRRFVGLDNSGFDGSLVVAPYRSEILRFEGFPYPVFDDFLGVVEQARNVTDLFAPDSTIRRNRYRRYADNIRNYRISLPRGQMLDNVLDYCSRAREHFSALEKIKPDRKNAEKIDASIEYFRMEQIFDPPDPLGQCN